MLMGSCVEQESLYPRYTITKITHVPDSLKSEYRLWVIETVRAASENMTGGDYEDVDETIIQAERTGEKIYGVETIGLQLEINENYWDDIDLLPNQLTSKELKILDSLRTR
tara:strand:- start:3670 stop:4002 length:333 start_codon:yes stop_codon:yes gene_type:complete